MGHKAFSESEQEELANSEEVLDFDKIPRKRTEQKSSHILLAGWPGVLIGMGIGVALTAGGMRMLSHPKSSTEVKPNQSRLAGQSVTVTQVRNTPITRTIEVTGTVAARGDLIPVLPQTTGLRIEQVLVEEGDTVQSKEVMAVLDNSVLKAELDQANAQLESAQAVVGQRKAAAAQA
ncbi:MAG: biotin/lipoyl-binding protein, partial [Chroococcidiopsidaceae cyanobacterium CP_BM_RX_35]|nr:biotin/lipoyl-binding protein [Chroococcidiopsidaceae cyanobacterium CP_BM_RX_35]